MQPRRAWSQARIKPCCGHKAAAAASHDRCPMAAAPHPWKRILKTLTVTRSLYGPLLLNKGPSKTRFRTCCCSVTDTVPVALTRPHGSSFDRTAWWRFLCTS
jgi:hypothetical protein